MVETGASTLTQTLLEKKKPMVFSFENYRVGFDASDENIATMAKIVNFVRACGRAQILFPHFWDHIQLNEVATKLRKILGQLSTTGDDPEITEFDLYSPQTFVFEVSLNKLC